MLITADRPPHRRARTPCGTSPPNRPKRAIPANLAWRCRHPELLSKAIIASDQVSGKAGQAPVASRRMLTASQEPGEARELPTAAPTSPGSRRGGAYDLSSRERAGCVGWTLTGKTLTDGR